jgi:3-hydroxyacyl-CoA dehydrogenase
MAQTFAQAGYAVRLHARHQDTLHAARDRIARNQEAMVRAGEGFSEYPPGGSEGAIAARDAWLFELLRLLQRWGSGAQ